MQTIKKLKYKNNNGAVSDYTIGTEWGNISGDITMQNDMMNQFAQLSGGNELNGTNQFAAADKKAPLIASDSTETLTNISLKTNTSGYNKWEMIGTYYFQGSGGEYVMLKSTAQSSNAYARAADIRFENINDSSKSFIMPVRTNNKNTGAHPYDFTPAQGVTLYPDNTWRADTAMTDSQGKYNSVYTQRYNVYIKYTPSCLKPGLYRVSFWNISHPSSIPIALSAQICCGSVLQEWAYKGKSTAFMGSDGRLWKETVKYVTEEEVSVYLCTGKNDNVAICKLVDGFLSTNDERKTLKLNIIGQAGISEEPIIGDGSYGSPKVWFPFVSENPYQKKVILDFANCTLPKLNLDCNNPVQAIYFMGSNNKDLYFRNITAEIEITGEYGEVFCFKCCSNLFECTAAASNTKSDIGAGGAFYLCDYLTNCTGTGNGAGGDIGGGFGFIRCNHLTDCSGIASGKGAYCNSHAFTQSTNLTGCVGYCTTDGQGYAYAFDNCDYLTQCTGTAEGTGQDYVALAFDCCSKIIGCIGTARSYHDCYCFRQCNDILNSYAAAYCIMNIAYGFFNCNRLTNCTGLGYFDSGSGMDGYGFCWGSGSNSIAQMINCNAPQKTVSGYSQSCGIMLLDDTTKYCIVGCTTYNAIEKHSAAGSEYFMAGNIIANIS